jgi:hypothetical protein
MNKIGGGGGGASRSPETKQTRVSLENMLVPEIKAEKKSGFATSGDEESSGLSEEEGVKEVVRRKEKRNIVKTLQEPESQIHSNNNSSHISVQSNIKTTNPPKPSPPSPKPPPPPTQ